MKQDAFAALARSAIVRDYEAAFQSATGLSLKLVPASPNGKRIPLAAHENPFCNLIAQSPGGCSACHKIQVKVLRRAGRKFSPNAVRCVAGLTVVAVPVVIGGEHIATLLGGQVHAKPPTRQNFARLTKILIDWGLQADLHDIQTAYFRTRVVGAAQLKSMVRLLTIFAQHLGDYANRQLIASQGRTEPRHVSATREFVRTHYQDPIHMRQAARNVHLSAFYFCKLFKKHTGLTFTEYLARTRVEKAKMLLLNPAVRVNEVAFAAGFQSIPHFNRIFKNYAGQSPTAYRTATARTIDAMDTATGA